MNQNDSIRLTHLSDSGDAQMVDVSAKQPAVRTAVASARFEAGADAINALRSPSNPKGDALSTARIAGICAAKRTSDLIPLCHSLALDHVQIDFAPESETAITVRASARTTARTGVEMEAMVAASIAALTLYDMVKSVDKSARVGPVVLEHKTGGKSGEYVRPGA